MTTPYCPHCALEVQRREKEGEVFWACRNRLGCGWTWPGDETGPLATSAHDGGLAPRVIQVIKEDMVARLDSRFPEKRGVVYRALLGQILDTEDLLEVGALKREWRERRVA